jgi:acetyl esterase/lipase
MRSTRNALIGLFVAFGVLSLAGNVALCAEIVLEDPPVLTLHGDQDALVPVEQARVLDEKMKAAGASHTLIVFEGQGHGFGGKNGKKAADATWEFFARHLKP